MANSRHHSDRPVKSQTAKSGRLLPNWQACYKCYMRRWMRDRGKRRKQQTNEQPPQEKPEPLQPRFLSATRPTKYRKRQRLSLRLSFNEGGGMEEPFAPEAMGGDGEGPAQQGTRAQRSRRRGRRGRGKPPATPAQAPTLPSPGGPTGEAAEAEAPSEVHEPAMTAAAPAQVSGTREVEGRGRAFHWTAGLRQEHVV